MERNRPEVSDARRTWVRPQLLVLGRVSALVRGGGKSGGTNDADPQSTTKTGGG